VLPRHAEVTGTDRRFFTSFVPGDGSPLGFYLAYGFVLTGDVDDGEPILALPLTPGPPGPHPTGSR
jgi:hypothetical protein